MFRAPPGETSSYVGKVQSLYLSQHAYLDTSGVMVSVYVNDVSGSPSHTITGLKNGTSYDFSVFGINMLGTGPSMDASATPSTVPLLCQSVTLINLFN